MDPYLRPDRRERARQRDKRAPPGRNHPLFTALRALVILLFGILIVQLVRLQVIDSDDYARLAEINALREVQIPAARGLILDQDGDRWSETPPATRRPSCPGTYLGGGRWAWIARWRGLTA